LATDTSEALVLTPSYKEAAGSINQWGTARKKKKVSALKKIFPE